MVTVAPKLDTKGNIRWASPRLSPLCPKRWSQRGTPNLLVPSCWPILITDLPSAASRCCTAW